MTVELHLTTHSYIPCTLFLLPDHPASVDALMVLIRDDNGRYFGSIIANDPYTSVI